MVHIIDMAAAMLTYHLPSFPDIEVPTESRKLSPKETSRGRCVGSDNGKAERQPARNEPCPCGSGIKFKKCCLGKPKGTVTP